MSRLASVCDAGRGRERGAISSSVAVTSGVCCGRRTEITPRAIDKPAGIRGVRRASFRRSTDPCAHKSAWLAYEHVERCLHWQIAAHSPLYLLIGMRDPYTRIPLGGTGGSAEECVARAMGDYKRGPLPRPALEATTGTTTQCAPPQPQCTPTIVRRAVPESRRAQPVIPVVLKARRGLARRRRGTHNRTHPPGGQLDPARLCCTPARHHNQRLAVAWVATPHFARVV